MVKEVLNAENAEHLQMLKKVSHPVTEFNERLFYLLDDMRDTIIDYAGIGLAAPQIAILRRVVVLDFSSDIDGIEQDEYIELINPEVLKSSGSQTDEEGCLSIPGERGLVTRANKVVVKFQDRHGKWHQREFEGLAARAVFHEIDHLNGVLYTQHVQELPN
ncbi:MAG: peptide deformylase [Firmicutes bacterium]|nr:peptide deformylase [Bacillota bacterium]